MWNLPKPDIQLSIDEIDDVIARSQVLSPTDKGVVEQLYHEYDNGSGVITRQRHDQTDQRIQGAMKTAYPKTYDGADLSYIRARLMNGVYKCPICSIGLPSTLDHVLPQSKYKALSVCGNNLVPMCRDCNSEKNNEDDRPMLHPYYDRLPVDRRFLYAEVIPTALGGVSFVFRVDDQVLTDPVLREKFNNTFDKCELDKAFSRELVTFLKDKLYKRGLYTIDDVKRYIAGELDREKELNGLNHWKVVVLYGIIESDRLAVEDLIQFL